MFYFTSLINSRWVTVQITELKYMDTIGLYCYSMNLSNILKCLGEKEGATIKYLHLKIPYNKHPAPSEKWNQSNVCTIDGTMKQQQQQK
jgi:hypothetical protein